MPQIVLSVSEPHEPRVDGRLLKKNGPAMREIARTQEVPDFVKNVAGIPILVNQDSQHIVVKDVEAYGTPQKIGQSDLILEFSSSGKTTLRLKGYIDRRLPLPENMTLNYTKCLDILLGRLGRDWKKNEEKVLVKFKETDVAERRLFRKSFTISKPELPDFGVFETVTTPPINIEPKTKADSQAWFEWLLVDQLPNMYLRPSAFREHLSEIKAKFPERFDLDEPSQAALAQKLFRTGDTPRAWLLQAPLDLLAGDVK